MRFLLGLAMLLAPACAAGATESGANYNYMAAALQGDLSGAEKALEQSDLDANKETLAKFRARFVARTDGLDLDLIANEAVRDVAAAYQEYWRDALLAPQDRAELEIDLIEDIRDIVAREGADASDFVTEAELERLRTEKENADRAASLISQWLVPWIEARGQRALTGRTQPFLELMLWARNREEMESVTLTDGVFDVPVIYQEGFVASGWTYFATFDRARAGGWANADGLFVVAEAYDDLNDESFQISFLKHEARHYVDATRYPNISPADREYRAKLTELIFARDSIDSRLTHFARSGARIDVAHPLANWHVTRDLADALYGESPPENWWENADHDRVRDAAARLLERHTATLDAAGADTTPGVIAP